ncbi:Zinc finger C2H2 [Penicillium atrosanguineum]|uniref:Zinc finger C2H2 n=1 Tax=Penicillium atrosanguineum TaxID=1132637 RepID=UPI0023A749E5|nr:Zinc finger C2H2 [Penicillium atrosanguineum]KAJ5298593.1 Zinc finger C2H2 [Penicillium atrosanguineum]
MVAHAGRLLTFRETDEADNLTATYVYSTQNVPSKRDAPSGRVDVMDPSSNLLTWSTKPLISSLSDVFLPSGYPQSDSLQAFCSSIAGLLSSRAVLQGVGVGDANASPSSALLLHILQDSSGRVATILFAHRVGTALEPECKTYRLAADVFNDIAMIMDCLSPMVPAGVMRHGGRPARPMWGCRGSSKASLSAHFAKWGNLAELNAKDSSQETVISLIGMLVGSVVVSYVTGFKATWAALLILLAAHLSLNYAAVRAVQMTSLNRQRANIIFSTLLESDSAIDLESLRAGDLSPKPKKDNARWIILTPAQVSQQERIFHRSGALHWTTPTQTYSLGTAEIGIPLSSFFKHGQTTRTSKTNIPMRDLATLFTHESYILYLHPTKPKSHASILLKSNCTVHTQLKAWMHALLALRVLSTSPSSSIEILPVLTTTLSTVNTRFPEYMQALSDSNWNITIPALETRSGRRVTLEWVYD